MSISFRSLLCAAVILLACNSAQAADRNMVRAAQEHLAKLGYFSGFYDGVLGPVTKASIKDFQRHNSLPVSGKLDEPTYHVLMAAGNQSHMAPAVSPVMISSMPEPQPPSPPPAPEPEQQPDVWHYVGSKTLPVSAGDLVVDEEAKGALYRYTVKLNGTPVLLADNQPVGLGVSPIFHLQGEDAVMVVASRGDDSCPYQNTLLSIHGNGTAASKYDFASCAAASEVSEAHGALFVGFYPGPAGPDGAKPWDAWRYENSQLIRL